MYDVGTIVEIKKPNDPSQPIGSIRKKQDIVRIAVLIIYFSLSSFYKELILFFILLNV